MESGRVIRISTNMVKAIRAYAHGRKGLDEETYRMHLQAVGVDSTLQLTRAKRQQLIERLRKLPDSPAWVDRRQGRAA